ERPKPLEHEALDAVGAAAEEGDLSRLVESVGAGDQATLKSELLRLGSEGIEGIPLLRAMLRRMLLLSGLRAQVEVGSRVDSVMASQGKSILWMEKEAVDSQLARRSYDLLAKVVEL